MEAKNDGGCHLVAINEQLINRSGIVATRFTRVRICNPGRLANV